VSVAKPATGEARETYVEKKSKRKKEKPRVVVPSTLNELGVDRDCVYDEGLRTLEQCTSGCLIQVYLFSAVLLATLGARSQGR